MSTVTNYDEGQYNYADYWRDRTYEQRADLLALSEMLRVGGHGWIADLGSGYRRLAPVYAGTNRPVLFVDYSFSLLRQAQAQYGPPSPARQYVAANLNYLPIRSGSVATCLLIRVMHHLPSYRRVLREVTRIGQSEWIIDVPQKLHALGRARALVRGRYRALHDEAPINLSHRPDRVFLNYHPAVIRRELERLGWRADTERSVSNFRAAWLTEHLHAKRLMVIERWAQPWLASLRFGPNIWIALSRSGVLTPIPDWNHLFACPRCGGDLELASFQQLGCSACGEHFTQQDGVWDLRWPRPAP